MRFAALCSLALCALVNAGDGTNDTVTVALTASVVATAPTGKAGKAGKNTKAKGKAATPTPSQLQDRSLPLMMSAAAPAPVALGLGGRSCPYNNCQSCTGQVGCYWTSAGCSSIPCSIYGPCAIAPAQCGGCQRDSQCGSAPRRCENGQCVGVEGDKQCDYYQDCGGCLSRPNCLWDPNTVTGSCKPKEQCDFTYQQRELVLIPQAAALPPATACVRSLDRCSQQNFNGVGLDLNTNRGVGCTNHAGCRPDQYCYSCSKCTGGCASCKAPGVPVAGMCGPAWRCPIDRDSISQTCPIITSPPVVRPPVYPVVVPPVVVPPVVRPPANTCNYQACGACTAAYGCVWSGTSCYYTTVPCNQAGCANTPAQCPRPVAPVVPVSNCAFNNCQNCAAAQGCAWSGQFCYYAVAPCTNYGCANTPAQCGGCTSDSQCGVGRRCDKGACLQSAGDYSCDYYSDCAGCLSNANCLWDPNVLGIVTHCKPKEQCDFTFRSLGLILPGSTPTPAPPPASACVKTVDKCSQTNFNGAALEQNQDRGLGCTTHGQCRKGEYCFSCSKCRGNCGLCGRVNPTPVSGDCAPASQCPVDLDSIDGLCPLPY